MKKITIIGAGAVGTTTAQRIVSFELAEQVVLLDVVEGLAEGKAFDIRQAAPLVESDCRITGTTSYEETADSDVVVITAGLTRKPGMSRDDLLARNASIVGTVTERIVRHSPSCILIPITNPVDEMTYVALNASGFDRSRVIGMAGMLDSARLRAFIAEELDVGVEDVSATVIGSHGDAMVPLIRYATVAGFPIRQFIADERIEHIVGRTRNAGSEIIDRLKTQSAFYAPSAAITSMIEAILHDKRRIVPCAVRLDGEYGLKNVVVGVPVKLGRNGVEQIVEIHLEEAEHQALRKAAGRIRENIMKLSL